MTLHKIEDSFLSLGVCQKGLRATIKKNARTGKILCLPLTNEPFSIDMKAVDSPERDHYTANFSNGIGKYLDKGFLYIYFSHVATGSSDRIVILSRTEIPGFNKISKKGSNSGSFTKYDNKLFETAGLHDQESYRLHPMDGTTDPFIFTLIPYIKDSGFVSDDPVLTISAPKQSGREDELGMKRLTKKPTCSGFEKYRKDNNKEMIRSKRDHGDKIAKPENRYIPGISCDHIHTVYDGHINKIPTIILSHWSNLQYISGPDNSSKGKNSWKTKDQLVDDYAAATGSTPSLIMKLFDDFKNQGYD
jgi:hypothetical protein